MRDGPHAMPRVLLRQPFFTHVPCWKERKHSDPSVSCVRNAHEACTMLSRGILRIPRVVRNYHGVVRWTRGGRPDGDDPAGPPACMGTLSPGGPCPPRWGTGTTGHDMVRYAPQYFYTWYYRTWCYRALMAFQSALTAHHPGPTCPHNRLPPNGNSPWWRWLRAI